MDKKLLELINERVLLEKKTILKYFANSAYHWGSYYAEEGYEDISEKVWQSFEDDKANIGWELLIELIDDEDYGRPLEEITDEELVEIYDEIFEGALHGEICDVVDTGIYKGEEKRDEILSEMDDDPNNYPFGPGMSMRDFVDY